MDAQLFSKKQVDREPVEVLLQSKYFLYQRIRENDTKRVMVATPLEFIRLNLHVTIRPTDSEIFAAPMFKAIETETDLDKKPNRP